MGYVASIFQDGANSANLKQFASSWALVRNIILGSGDLGTWLRSKTGCVLPHIGYDQPKCP